MSRNTALTLCVHARVIQLTRKPVSPTGGHCVVIVGQPHRTAATNPSERHPNVVKEPAQTGANQKH